MENSISMLDAIARGIKVEENAGVQKVMVLAPNDGCSEAFKPMATVSNNIDANNLIRKGKDVVSFQITNGALVDQTVIIGLGLLNVTGNPANFGIANAAVDNALVTDQFGAGAAKTSFFSQFVNGHGYIAEKISVFGASAAQVVESLVPASITPNGDLKRTAGANTKIDTNLNYAVLEGCPTPLNFYSGVLYNLQAGETVTIEVMVLGVATIENYTDGLK